MKPIPANPARDAVAAATSKHPQPGGPPAPAQRFSDEARALMAKHAAERATLEADQWNARVDMTERHAAETSALREKEAKQAAANAQLEAAAAAAPPPPAAPAPGRRGR